ncbi:hypothetical protein LQL77_29965 [Rhodococcus cerastii]|nr:hypothetical protein [Rhodococcus cerastii]
MTGWIGHLGLEARRQRIHQRSAGGRFEQHGVGDELTAIFTSLAHQITGNTNLRAGMKLTLEPTIAGGSSFARWIDAISDIVENFIPRMIFALVTLLLVLLCAAPYVWRRYSGQS